MKFQELNDQEKKKYFSKVHRTINTYVYSQELKPVRIRIRSIENEDGLYKAGADKSDHGEIIINRDFIDRISKKCKTGKKQTEQIIALIAHVMVYQYCHEKNIDERAAAAQEHYLKNDYKNGELQENLNITYKSMVALLPIRKLTLDKSKPFTNNQIDTLFEEYAVRLPDVQTWGIPFDKAKEIFGESEVNYIFYMKDKPRVSVSAGRKMFAEEKLFAKQWNKRQIDAVTAVNRTVEIYNETDRKKTKDQLAKERWRNNFLSMDRKQRCVRVKNDLYLTYTGTVTAQNLHNNKLKKLRKENKTK